MWSGVARVELALGSNSDQMPKPYRVLIKDFGHVRTSDIVYAESDEEAAAKAREFLVPPQEIELRDGGRFVACWNTEAIKPY